MSEETAKFIHNQEVPQVTRETKHFLYGQTELDISYEKGKGGVRENLSLTLSLGEHSLSLPKSSSDIAKPLGLLEVESGYDLGEYDHKRHAIRVNVDAADRSKMTPLAILEEYFHAMSEEDINTTLSAVENGKDIPKKLQILPEVVQQLVLSQASIIENNRDDIANNDPFAVLDPFFQEVISLVHEMLTKRLVVQTVLEWTGGDVSLMGFTEKDFFEMMYLSLAVKCPDNDMFAAWGLGMPIREAIKNRIKTEEYYWIMKEMEDRLHLMDSGMVIGSDEDIPSLIPDNYKETAAYAFFFDSQPQVA